MTQQISIFDRKLKRIHRDRSASILSGHDFLIKEAEKIVLERFGEDIVKKFPVVLSLNNRFPATLTEQLKQNAGTETIFYSGISARFLENTDGLKLIADEELLPFAQNSFDLVISILNLHWVNDLPGCLAQIRNCLKKDGLFIASIFGGETLKELRQAMVAAEIEEIGGANPRISPMIETRDSGALLQRAGFKLSVSDNNKFTVMYGDIMSLVKDLRAMGETNALLKRSKYPITRSLIDRIEDKYKELYAENGRIPVSFEIITMTGWKP